MYSFYGLLCRQLAPKQSMLRLLAFASCKFSKQNTICKYHLVKVFINIGKFRQNNQKVRLYL